MRISAQVLLVLCLIFTLVSLDVSWAATTGKLTGVVKDSETNEPVANAKVTIQGKTYTTLTNSEGYYVITNVPPGTYSVIVERVGFGAITKTEVRVASDLTTTLGFSLTATLVEIEGITERAAKPLIQPDVTQSTAIIAADDLKEIPRDTVGGVLQTVAGASVTRDGGGAELHIRGGRAMEIKYVLDGVSLDDPILRGMSSRVSTNSLEEMQVITGGFNAEFGDAQSAVINMVTKEGTEKFHGRFEYRIGEFSDHFGDPLYGAWRNPDEGFRLEAVELYRGIFLGQPYDYQQPYRGDDRTIADLADEGIEWAEILPGVWSEHTTNPDGESFQDSDGTIINYEELAVELPDGLVIDLNQYANLFNPTNDYDLDRAQIGEFELSGPIWGNRLTFSLASEIRKNPGYLPNDEVTGRVFQGKLKFVPVTGLKLTLSGLSDYSEADTYGGYVGFGNYGQDWRFNPGATPRTVRDNKHFTLNLSHNLSSATFYDVSLGYLDADFSNNQWRENPETGEEEEILWDPFLTADENAELIKDSRRLAYSSANHAVAGDFHRWSQRRSLVKTVRGAITSQMNRYHQVKTGVELELKDLERLSVTNWGSSNVYVDVFGGTELNKDISDVTPTTFAWYAQDKMEFQGMIVNAGVRFDLFDPAAQYPENELDPLVLNDDGTVKIDPVTNMPILKNPVDASVKTQISPRLGISYPVTERSKLHFTYGHYFQVPRAQDLYENLNYDMRGAIRRMGNADLKPEKTVAYEFGVEHQLTDDLVADVTLFSKDIDNLVDSRHVTPENNAANDYSYFVNGIYGHAQGIELTLRKQRTEEGFWSGAVSYTYSSAMGKGSARGSGYLTYYYQQPEITESWPLDWDQPHVVSAVLNVKLPLGFGVNAVGQYGSGLPYTPDPEAPIKPAINSKRYPSSYNLDMLVSKKLTTAGLTYSLFADIRNVFNQRNLIDVIDPVTYDRYGVPLNDKKHPDPLAYSIPRQVLLGASIEW